MQRSLSRSSRFTRHTAVLAALAGAALPAVAEAQITVSPLIVGGDTVGTLSIVTGIGAVENLAINDAGQWRINATGSTSTSIIVQGVTSTVGAIIVAEGDPTPFPPLVYGSFDSLRLNDAGNLSENRFYSPTGPNDSGVHYNGSVIIREGDLATATGFSANTPYIGFFETYLNDNNEVAVLASVDDPAIASSVDRALVLISSPGGTPVQTVLAKEGDTMVPGRLLTDFQTSPANIALANGHLIAIMDLDGGTGDDGIVMTWTPGGGWVEALREGQPSTVAGRNWGTLSSTSALDINDSGKWAIRTTLNAPTTDDQAVFTSTGEIFAREGSAVPAALGAFQFTGITTSNEVRVDDAGNVYYYATWNDPDTTRNSAIFRNNDVILQKGTVLQDGRVITTISPNTYNFDVSGNGQHMIAEVVLTDPFGLVRSGSVYISIATGTGACNLADITEVGGTEENPGNPDGQLTVDDLILFVNLFSAGTGCPGTAPCNRADVTGIGGSGAAPDGELTVDDLIEFVNAFSTGC